MFSTRVSDLLKIKYPILLAPMGMISKPPLVAAVSNAGGIGMLSAGFINAKAMQEQIKETRELTDAPFGVNIPLAITSVNRIVKVLQEEEIKIIFTSAGSPSQVLNQFKSDDVITLHLVPTTRIAKKVEAMGVDMLVAQGSDAGGIILPNGPSIMVLIPQIVDAVDIPVIAAGGIADGRGFVAACALGAEGVLMGTRFLCSEECPVSEIYKQAVIESKDDDTQPLKMGKLTTRVWKNEAVIEHGNEIDPSLGSKIAQSSESVDLKESIFVMGMSSGLVKSVKSVSMIFDDIISEVEKVKTSISS